MNAQRERIIRHLREEKEAAQERERNATDYLLGRYYDGQIYAFDDAIDCVRHYGLRAARFLCEHGAELSALARTSYFQGQQWAYERAVWTIDGGWDRIEQKGA